ncbi:ABC transporter ATP-binding protein [Intestinibacter sp.]|uniref:ABC transporter ATP-binding protein n=1 Tax=Intestinibacter sp. TaxID=1965304 RepID=UPI002A75D492|nr:ABC transporter ATP-binding protein [Intestinibacter sp.]MDY2736387.1 ABC transporter ATP-binding protein [Intestinibacter sp.]
MKLFKEVIQNNLKMIIFYVLIGIIINFLDLYSVTYYQKILDAFQFKTLTIIPIIIYGFLLLISTILGYIENYPEQQVKNKLYLDFKLQSLKKMQSIDYLEYQKIGTGKITQKVEDGATASRDVLIDFWLKLFRYLLPTAIFSLIFIFRVKKELVLFVFGGYVIVVIISNIILKKLYKLKESILFNQEFLNKHLVRGFMELVVFRTNKKFDTEIEVSKEGIKNIVDAKTKIKLVHEIFFTVFALIVNFLKVIVLGYAVLKSDLSVGAVVTVLSLLGKAYEPIAIFNVEYVDYKLNKVAVKKYIDFLDIKDDEYLTKGTKIKTLNGKIELKNISYAYNEHTKNIIENLSLNINENTSVALVGESGSGKSTIIKLIMGLIKYKKGNILIDQKELSNLNLNSFYDNVTYVSQEAPIFDGTLRENLVFDKKIDDEIILGILKLVCLEKFYERLDNGLETELGEKGIRMSGGERQRVALARLFFDDSKIIILDEATSAMDNITEKNVMHNILNKLKNKTIIIIAHRLETIKDVDNIFVLSDGKIAEEGKYLDLLEKNGYFKDLYKSSK